MHPGFYAWWKRAHGPSACGGPSEWAGPMGHERSAPRGGPASWEASGECDGEWGGGSFGVRRPLRFLAHKLELTDAQVTELAAILNELKTERAQASVDYRRTTSALADALTGADFDEAKAREAGDGRVHSAERLRDAVLRALKQIHGLLDDEQRRRLSYLLRTGTLSI